MYFYRSILNTTIALLQCTFRPYQWLLVRLNVYDYNANLKRIKLTPKIRVQDSEIYKSHEKEKHQSEKHIIDETMLRENSKENWDVYLMQPKPNQNFSPTESLHIVLKLFRVSFGFDFYIFCANFTLALNYFQTITFSPNVWDVKCATDKTTEQNHFKTMKQLEFGTNIDIKKMYNKEIKSDEKKKSKKQTVKMPDEKRIRRQWLWDDDT